MVSSSSSLLLLLLSWKQLPFTFLLLLGMASSPISLVSAWVPTHSPLWFFPPSRGNMLAEWNRYHSLATSSSYSSTTTICGRPLPSSSTLKRFNTREVTSSRSTTTCRRATSHHHSMDEASTTTTTTTSPKSSAIPSSTSTAATAVLEEDSLQHSPDDSSSMSPMDEVWKRLIFLVPNRVQDLNHNNNDGTTTTVTLTPDDIVNVQKAFLNLSVLLCSFGFALYTIISIDSEITRGWTQQEIAMRIPIDNWAGYESALQEAPILTKTTINVVIYLLGDWLSQTLFQKKSLLDFDVKRTLRNGFIGLCFGPLVHLYYEWSDTILPVEGGIMNRLQKIGMDQTLYLSVKCSIYIMAVGCLQGDSIQTSWTNVQQRILPICFTAWKFWPLVHCITYSVIPSQHRILWVNCVDLVWNAILATMSRSKEDDGTTATDSEVVIVVAADGTTTTRSNPTKTTFIVEEDLVPMPVLAGGSEVLTAVGNEALLIRDFVMEMTASSYKDNTNSNNDDDDDDDNMQTNHTMTGTVTTMSEEVEDSIK